MGEIGLNRREYLYDLTLQDLLLIGRGYCRRSRDSWSQARWMTYNIMLSFCGSKSLSSSGINSPKDLIKFPWEEEIVAITQAERDELLAEIDAMNNLNNDSL